MSDVSQWDPQSIAQRAHELWWGLDRKGTWAMTLEEAQQWAELGRELLELSNRLTWLDLYRGPGGAS